MYIPEYTKITDIKIILDFIRSYGFGIVLTSDEEEIQTSFLPFNVVTQDNHIYLESHFARKNLHWRGINEGQTVTVLFHGPHSYISPRYYTKASVPTWNYSVVKVTGKSTIIEDLDKIKQMSTDLVEKYEHGRWEMAQLLDEEINKLVKRVVGIRIQVNAVQGKFKLSQNKSKEDIANVLGHLEMGTPGDKELAEFMKKHS